MLTVPHRPRLVEQVAKIAASPAAQMVTKAIYNYAKERFKSGPSVSKAKSRAKSQPPRNNDVTVAPVPQPVPNSKRYSDQITAPVSVARVTRRSRPRQKYLSNGDVLITHSEYFSEVTCNTSFTSNGFAINPGNQAIFPWLSRIATAFDKYRFESLCFRYLPDCSTASAGRIIMAVDFDATDPAPGNKVQVMTYRNATATPAWAESCCKCTNEDLHAYPQYYVSTSAATTPSGALNAPASLRQNSVGNLWVCSQGGSNSLTGELYVEYTVRLITPQISGNIGYLPYVLTYDTSASLSPNNLVNPPQGFNGSTIWTTGYDSNIGLDSLNISLVQVSGNYGYVFNSAGRYLITMYVTGTGLSGNITGGGGTTAGSLTLNGHTYNHTAVGSGATWCVNMIIITALAGQAFYPTITGSSVGNVTVALSQLSYTP